MKSGTLGFHGQRLVEAREARGLTGVALADLVDVTRTSITQYEKNVQTPRPEVMERLVQTLNLPIMFFMRPPEAESVRVLHYRSLAAATKASRKRAQRRHEWTRCIVAWLAQFTEFPRVDFPDVNPPSDPGLIDREFIERAAVQTRRHWSMADGPIDRVVWLLENHGAIVSLSDFGTEDLDAFSESGTGEFEPYISVSVDKKVAARSNFTASHELGHLLLHRNVPVNVANRSSEHKLMEQQANIFADAFLLPSTSFLSELRYPTLDGFRALKARWRVSIGAMIMRSRDLNLLTQDQFTKLWIAYSKRGWKHGEPMDDVLIDARPRVLRRAFELLVSERVVSREEIVATLPFSSTDIESLCGLDEGFLSDGYSPSVIRMSGRQTQSTREERMGEVISFIRRRDGS